jgi:hypothetical protein
MRKVFIAAGIVSMVSMATAQKLEFGVDGGYGFGYGASLVGQNIERDSSGSTIKYEQVYASGGRGVKIRGEVVYFFNENVGIMVASGYSMKSNYTTEIKDPFGAITLKGTTSYLPINIGLKFRAKMGIMGINVVPYAYVAPGIFFPKKTETATDPTNGTTVLTYSYAKGGFGVSAGVGTAVMLSNSVGIKVEFSPTYAFANPTKYRKEVNHPGYPPIDSTYTYKNDTPPEKLAPGEVSDQPHDSYCSMVVRVGIVYKIF